MYQQHQISGVHTLTQTQTQSASLASERHSSYQGSRQSSFHPFNQGQGISTGIEYAQNEAVYHDGMRVIGERVVETETIVPKKVYREEIIEKTIVIPEKVVREEVVEETQKVRERIIQVEKPVWVDKYVENEVLETVEKIVEKEQIEIVYHERPIEKVVVQEVVVTRPVLHEKIKIVEVDQPQYVEKPQIKVVEVPEVKIVYKDVPKPIDQHIVVDVPVVKEVEVYKEVTRQIPTGVEAIIHQDYHLPQLQPEVEEIHYPVFVPKFTEVPVPADQMTEESKLEATNLMRQVQMATGHQMPSLCLLEDLGQRARNYVPNQETRPEVLQQRYEQKIREVDQNNKPSAVPEI